MKLKTGVIASAAIAIGVTLLWATTQEGKTKTEPSGDPTAQWMQLSTRGTAPSLGDQATGAAVEDQRHMLTRQLTEAKQRLQSYRDATKYPPESQPISMHGDVLKPFAPVIEDHAALSSQGVPISGRRLLTSQDRVYVSGQDSALFTVAMRDDQNKPAPLRVIRAIAHEIQSASRPQNVMPAAIQFEDKGQNGDVAAGDGIFSARLQPAAMPSLATAQGTIRVDLDLQSDTGGPAHAFFDIVYMPNVPAVWSGSVREVMEDGSLAFYLRAEMREAGRYIVTARAYDATGKPFALLSFNEEVPAGTNEIRLQLFGKLVRDAKPIFPITLRDIDGFVLYESRFPDRAMMSRWAQTAYTSRPHAITEFAEAEWSSEQRQRYLTEYDKDVQLAEQSLLRSKP